MTETIDPVIFHFHHKPKHNLGLDTELPVSTYHFKNNSPGIRIEEKSHITIKQLYASIILVMKVVKNR